LLRQELAAGLKRRESMLLCPLKELCTDNAAMIGAAGYFHYQMGDIAGYDLNATPAWGLAKERKGTHRPL